MKMRALAVILAAGLLGGCTTTDWDHAMNYAGLGEDAEQQTPPDQSSDAQTAETQPVQPAHAAVQTAAMPAPIARDSAAPPPEPAAQDDSWCATAAKSAREDAIRYGFDEATQKRQADKAYAQCMQFGGQR
jgi:hypothetical protein